MSELPLAPDGWLYFQDNDGRWCGMPFQRDTPGGTRSPLLGDDLNDEYGRGTIFNLRALVQARLRYREGVQLREGYLAMSHVWRDYVSGV